MIVWLGPAFTVYVTIEFGVPVKVTVADCPEQIVWLDAMLAVGRSKTVITTEPETGCKHELGPLAEMLTSVKVVVVVYVPVIVAEPEAFNVIVWLGPPFTV